MLRFDSDVSTKSGIEVLAPIFVVSCVRNTVVRCLFTGWPLTKANKADDFFARVARSPRSMHCRATEGITETKRKRKSSEK